MDTRLLETFQAVVACGTFARAAEQLGYTQSTVTVHIKQLEQELGVPLFERIGRRMVLTQKGEEALAQANQVVAEVARLRSLGTEGGELTGTLRVDMAETLLCHGMDRVLTEFRELPPMFRCDCGTALANKWPKIFMKAPAIWELLTLSTASPKSSPSPKLPASPPCW